MREERIVGREGWEKRSGGGERRCDQGDGRRDQWQGRRKIREMGVVGRIPRLADSFVPFVFSLCKNLCTAF
jgi:hypothetical protein